MKKMRLIDADALIRIVQQSAQDAGLHFSDSQKFLRWLRNARTINAVPVVRCKDCKWRFSSNCPMFHEEPTYSEDDGYEWIDRDNTSDDGFCEQGARMDGEAE